MSPYSHVLKRLQTGLGIILLLPLAGFAAGLPVTVSIKPVYSLVAGVMQGIGEPHLLVTGGVSPHDYRLRPSDVRAIEQARVVFWIGPNLENFLIRPLENVQGGVRTEALLEAPGIRTLPLRAGGAWETHRHADEQPDEAVNRHDHDHATSVDAHIWLDPVNAIAMTRQIVKALSAVDMNHQADYERNGAALIERLNRLDQQLAADLTPIREQPYVVFHDAYQYFEQRYGLRAIGSVVLDPEQQPGARRVAVIQARMRDLKVRCVFSEPQFEPALAATLVSGSDARLGILDPLGAELSDGPDAYFQLLEGLANALRACLSDD
ncbi:MAG: zinc ABC transporter substrate-binding protein [Candidatus Competibacteraceae bacterium]|nr:zinc ABC transporter substrate-binding protein [Candidatus Competibacteraceae bacterium]MCB1821358.1 zinc ABC transporter substrate-binding protein [Candidatus Competibacteraceae bacterium]HRY15925.1 zinc ABC transporter substrate-binding protein [Candidatus Competibacteraceae bacterium]